MAYDPIGGGQVGTLSAGGSSNTLGQVIFSNAGGVSFGLSNGTMTASAPAGGGGLTNINLSAGSTSNNLSAFQFSNGSGVTFGLNGSTVTASVQTNYLTTAMASNRGSDFVQATAAFAGTNASGTIASNGISVSVAAPTVQTAFVFSNSNGVSFGTNGSTVTATVATNYQSQGAYLTTARASNDAIGLNSALTANGVSVTANSSGLSLNFPAFLTTAMQSNAATISNIRVSAGTTSNLLSAITFSNSNGVSFGLNAGTMTASHNGLTTARASNDAVGLNTAQSNVTWSVNSSGISIDARGYAGTGLSLTNATATLNSNGLQLSVGGGGVTNQTGPNIAAGGVTVTNGTVVFSNSNGVSFGIAGSTMTASVNAAGGATRSFYENIPVIHGTQTFNAVSSTMYIYPFSLDDNISVGFIRLPMSVSFAPTTGGVPVLNSTITGQMGFTNAFVIYTQGTGANSNSLQYFTSTSGTGSFGTTVGAGAQSSQQTVTINGSFGQSGNQTNLGTGTSYGVSSGSYVINSSAMSNFTGPRFVDIPFAQSLTPGDYWMGIGRSWSSANNSSIFNGVNPLSSNIFISQTNITWGIMGSATNTSNVMRQPGAGYFTTNASLISTASINAVGQISVTTSNLVPYFQFIRKA